MIVQLTPLHKHTSDSPVGMCADQNSRIFRCTEDCSFRSLSKCERLSCAERTIDDERNCGVQMMMSIFQYVINDFPLMTIQFISIAVKSLNKQASQVLWGSADFKMPINVHFEGALVFVGLCTQDYNCLYAGLWFVPPQIPGNFIFTF